MEDAPKGITRTAQNTATGAVLGGIFWGASLALDRSLPSSPEIFRAIPPTAYALLLGALTAENLVRGTETFFVTRSEAENSRSTGLAELLGTTANRVTVAELHWAEELEHHNNCVVEFNRGLTALPSPINGAESPGTDIPDVAGAVLGVLHALRGVSGITVRNETALRIDQIQAILGHIHSSGVPRQIRELYTKHELQLPRTYTTVCLRWDRFPADLELLLIAREDSLLLVQEIGAGEPQLPDEPTIYDPSGTAFRRAAYHSPREAFVAAQVARKEFEACTTSAKELVKAYSSFLGSLSRGYARHEIATHTSRAIKELSGIIGDEGIASVIADWWTVVGERLDEDGHIELDGIQITISAEHQQALDDAVDRYRTASNSYISRWWTPIEQNLIAEGVVEINDAEELVIITAQALPTGITPEMAQNLHEIVEEFPIEAAQSAVDQDRREMQKSINMFRGILTGVTGFLIATGAVFAVKLGISPRWAYYGSTVLFGASYLFRATAAYFAARNVHRSFIPEVGVTEIADSYAQVERAMSPERTQLYITQELRSLGIVMTDQDQADLAALADFVCQYRRVAMGSLNPYQRLAQAVSEDTGTNPFVNDSETAYRYTMWHGLIVSPLAAVSVRFGQLRALASLAGQIRGPLDDKFPAWTIVEKIRYLSRVVSDTTPILRSAAQQRHIYPIVTEGEMTEHSFLSTHTTEQNEWYGAVVNGVQLLRLFETKRQYLAEHNLGIEAVHDSSRIPDCPAEITRLDQRITALFDAVIVPLLDPGDATQWRQLVAQGGRSVAARIEFLRSRSTAGTEADVFGKIADRIIQLMTTDIQPVELILTQAELQQPVNH